MGWHWLNTNGNFFPCVCLWYAISIWLILNDTNERCLLLFEPLQRIAVLGGAIEDLYAGLVSRGAIGREKHLERRAHHFVFCTKGELRSA